MDLILDFCDPFSQKHFRIVDFSGFPVILSLNCVPRAVARGTANSPCTECQRINVSLGPAPLTEPLQPKLHSPVAQNVFSS